MVKHKQDISRYQPWISGRELMGAVLTGLARWGQQAGQTVANMLKPSAYLWILSVEIWLADLEADRAESQDSKIWEAVGQQFQFKSTGVWPFCQLNREIPDLLGLETSQKSVFWRAWNTGSVLQSFLSRIHTEHARTLWQVNVELLLEILSELRVVVKARCLGQYWKVERCLSGLWYRAFSHLCFAPASHLSGCRHSLRRVCCTAW